MSAFDSWLRPGLGTMLHRLLQFTLFSPSHSTLAHNYERISSAVLEYFLIGLNPDKQSGMEIAECGGGRPFGASGGLPIMWGTCRSEITDDIVLQVAYHYRLLSVTMNIHDSA